MITPIIQVTNVAPTATRDQMKTLFSFVGKIDELKLYPTEDIAVPVKVCFVKFEDSSSAGVALHLTNTVFIDRALSIGPYSEPAIPDEGLGMQISLQAVAGTLPGNSASWPSNVVSKLQGTGVGQVISTVDPKLTSLGLPQYPLLPANTDPSKIEEIRRTVYVGNLDPTVTAEQVLNFFTQAGEVKFVRMAGDDGQSIRFAFVEFSDQRSIPKALAYNSVMFAGRQLKVNHSNNAIVKPHVKPEAAQREIDEAMRKVKEAQSLISAAIDPGKGSRSRSRSRSRKERSRSRSRKSNSKSRRHSRSRQRSRSRKRSRSRGRRSRSRKKSRSRSKTRIRKPSRSRSRSRNRRSRSKGKRSRSRTRHSSRSRRKTPPRAYSRRKSRSTSRNRKRRSRSRTRKHRSKSVEKKKSASKSPSPPTLKKEMSPNSSPVKNDDKEISKPELIAESDKESTRKLEEAPEKKSSTPPRKQSCSRSPSISKSKRARRSSSPRKRSRSRSGSRHRQSSRNKKRKERDRSRDRRSDRDRDRDRDRDSKKRHRDIKDRDHRDRDDKAEVKIKRDYDEEEKGYTSPGRREDTDRTVSPSPGKPHLDSSPGGKNGRSVIDVEATEKRKEDRESDDMDTSD